MQKGKLIKQFKTSDIWQHINKDKSVSWDGKLPPWIELHKIGKYNYMVFTRVNHIGYIVAYKELF